ncbi:unnamed protein product [Linum tenue]|uniref:Uncharacterized protein n=1 Tax=Linum tenue TaxID=586396 RepID=A0AAV0P1C3_9ROSI|nr:unnamed protein product [Linum tenue]
MSGRSTSSLIATSSVKRCFLTQSNSSMFQRFTNLQTSSPNHSHQLHSFISSPSSVCSTFAHQLAGGYQRKTLVFLRQFQIQKQQPSNQSTVGVKTTPCLEEERNEVKTAPYRREASPATKTTAYRSWSQVVSGKLPN